MVFILTGAPSNGGATWERGKEDEMAAMTSVGDDGKRRVSPETEPVRFYSDSRCELQRLSLCQDTAFSGFNEAGPLGKSAN